MVKASTYARADFSPEAGDKRPLSSTIAGGPPVQLRAAKLDVQALQSAATLRQKRVQGTDSRPAS